MASQLDTPKPDLGTLRIPEHQRSKSGMRKRLTYALIPVIVFVAIVDRLLAAEPRPRRPGGHRG